MKKSAEFERSSDFNIKRGTYESDFTFNVTIFRPVSVGARYKTGSTRVTMPGSGNQRFEGKV